MVEAVNVGEQPPAPRLLLLERASTALAAAKSVEDVCERLSAALRAHWSHSVVSVDLREGTPLPDRGGNTGERHGDDERGRTPQGTAADERGTAPTPQGDDERGSGPERSSRLTVPIRADDTTYGLLRICGDRPHAFNADDRAVLVAIAQQAAMAIQNARLFTSEAELRQRAERRARRLEHVQRVGEQLKMDLDEAAIGQRVVEAATDALGFRFTVLNLVDRPGISGARARVVACAGIPADGRDVLMAHDYPVSDIESLFQPEFLVSRSYFIPEGATHIADSTDIPVWTPSITNDGPNAWLAQDELLVPLTDRQGGHLLGFLSVSHPDHGCRPEREEVEVLEIFCDQAVVALRNARLLGEARYLAERDSLTGLLNHRAAHARLERELRGAEVSGRPLGVIALDMDDFKLINDTHGHHAGDLALRHIADMLTRVARAADSIARIGGDEFLVILPDATLPQTTVVARRLIAAIRDAPLSLAGVGLLPLRVSVGAATFPEDAAQTHALLAVADTRLYEAKRRPSRLLSSTGSGCSLVYCGDHDGFEFLNALVGVVDGRDQCTRQHSEQVAALACALGCRLGLSGASQRALRLAGLVHDVGKVGVPPPILRKPGPLDAAEWDMIRRHVVISTDLVRAAIPNPDVVAAVAHHHEHWDGGGYPDGVAASGIPLLARIMALANAASAMSSNRPYRQALRPEVVAAELRRGAGAQFDPELVEHCVAVFDVARTDAA